MKLFSKIILIVNLIVLQNVNSFNLDVVNYIQHEGQPDSMFGFSVALHQEAQRSWVIVGAPTADTSNIQDGVRNGGAVYRCDIADDNRCNIIPFDSKGNSYNDKNEQVDTKSNQWFGATVASAGIDGPLVACAPRYVFHQLQPRKVERVEPVGTCIIARNNFQSYDEYSPCRTMYWGYHRQGSCQAGFSASLTKQGDRVFVGAPGSYYWQGQVYSINTDAVFPYKPPRYGQFGEGGQIYSFGLNNPKDKVWSTGESTAQEDDSYLGYSSATGDFNGDGTQGVAVGMPRGGGLLGKVLIFSWNMTNQQNITGEQIGAYFGYALAVVDVDGDKLDDLIIGAPMYTEPNNEGKYETGRVYIMYQSKANKFKELDTRDGVNSKARFGLSLCSLGDINLDGFGDFAVGAPYDGPNGKGAVYIYHGSSKGPLEKYSQAIYAEDVAGVQRISTFGFSLSGGIDLDGNMYPDLVVGAYEADKALIFKARPVAVMEASTLFEADNKLISLEERNCTTKDRKQVSCTVVNSCLKYNGMNLPPTVDIEISWVLDSKKPRSPRMFFINEEGKNIRNSTMRLYRNKLECKSERVYITDNIRDKITPLEVEMRYNLRTSAASQTRKRRALLEPILDQNRGTIQRDSVNIQKNCGPDNVCIPDLRLDVKTVDKYLLGSKELLIIEALISNFGEDAFEAGFYMNVPAGLNFKKIEKIGDIKDTPITCTAPSRVTNNMLKCDIGNPLSSGKVVNFKVILNPSHKAGMAPSYDFFMEANSTNAEVEGAHMDNVFKKSIGIWIETDLSISGKSLPTDFHYNASQFSDIDNATEEHELGPQVVHIYNIRNNGPSTIEEAEIYVLWPYETRAGDSLMYLLNQPETSGNIKCDPTIYVNERDLLLDASLSRKSYLESVGVAVRRDYYSRAGYHGSSGQTGAGSSGTSGSSSSSSSSSSSGSSSSGSSSSGSSYSGSSQSSSSRGAAGANRNVILSQDEKRKLDDEEEQESTGDASYVHRQRAGQAAQSSAQTGGFSRTFESRYGSDGSAGSAGAASAGRAGSSREQTFQSSWNSSSSNNGPVMTYSSSRNRSSVRGEDGKVIVSESSTEHYGKSVAAFGGIGAGSGNSGQAIHKEDFSDIYRQESTQNSNSNSRGSQSSNNGSRYRGTINSESSQSGGIYKSDNVAGNDNVNQDISNLGSRTNSRHSQSFGSASRTSTGSSSSDNVNQDISELNSRTQNQYGGSSSYSSGGSGRRRMMSQQDGEVARADLITGVSSFEKAAQGRGGLQTTTVDLGILNRQNVDEDVRRSGGAAQISGSRTSGSSGSSSGGSSSYGTQNQNESRRTDGSSYTYTSSSSHGGSQQGSSSSSSSSRTGNQSSFSQQGQGGTYGVNTNEDEDADYIEEEYDEIEDDYSNHDIQDMKSNQQGSSHTSQRHINQGHDNVDQKFKHYQRFRRQTNDQTDQEMERALHCNATRCAILRCIAGPLGNDDDAWIALRARIVAKTLHKIASSTAINLSTMTVARVVKLPYIGSPKDKPIKSHEVIVTATPEPELKPDVVPLWVVVAAACAGTIILILLVYLLYKCGFFNRNRPSDSSERQPLNRNGNYHGDEHL